MSRVVTFWPASPSRKRATSDRMVRLSPRSATRVTFKTGDSTLAHLHFQLNDGPDPFFSRSILVAFPDAKQLYL